MSTGEIVYSKCEYINMCVVVVDWKRRVFFSLLTVWVEEWQSKRKGQSADSKHYAKLVLEQNERVIRLFSIFETNQNENENTQRK